MVPGPQTGWWTAGAFHRKVRKLRRYGNVGAGSPYHSRSETDFAVSLAKVGAGYKEAEVWTVMTDPTNGISETSLEKGRHAEGESQVEDEASEHPKGHQAKKVW
jgi:hypothetical protein